MGSTYSCTLGFKLHFAGSYHASEYQLTLYTVSYIHLSMQVSRVYDKSVVTDSIIKAVSMFRKSYCDGYLKQYLVTGTFRPDNGGLAK